MSRASRVGISVAASLLVFVGLVLFVFPSGCNDGGGVSSWDRCITPMGTPAFSVEDWGWDSTLNVVPPVVAAVLIGFLVCAILGRVFTSYRHRQSQNETAQNN
jgi:NhaP-type Na+/H+ or K+/H+ antiporter